MKNFIFLQGTLHCGWFPEIYEMFQNSYFKEHFWMATFEIISESHPFLSKNAGCSSYTLTGMASANQVFQKMLHNFLEHLTYQ